jgi:thiamine biosynthesis lipoprotein
VSVTFRALGTTAVVAVADDSRLSDALPLVVDEIAAVDAACSRFRSDSELMRLPSGCSVVVSPLLSDALAAALDAARATGGIVDPTVGRTLRLAGYDATYRVVARRDPSRFEAAFVPVPGWRVVEHERATRTVAIPPGVELDLGATAKAFAADRCARIAAEATGTGVLVSLGGDVAVAGEPPPGGWSIGIADDHAAPEVDETVAIEAGGLATSSTTVRRWRSGERELHHLIDPRTGRPADSCWRTVSVAAGSCLAANVATTAAIVLGENACEWLEARGLAARLVTAGGEVATTGHWPSPVPR